MTIGIPKGENLLGKVEKLFKEAGVVMRRESEDSLALCFSESHALVRGVLVRARRIPHLLMRQDLDLGIVGEDILEEHGKDVEVLLRLRCERVGLSPTRVALFCAQDDPVHKLEDMPLDACILSEYPTLTRKFLGKGSAVKIEPSPGGSEAEVPLAYRFGVAVTETGRTLEANGLRVIRSLFTSVPVLAASRSQLLYSKKREVAQWLVAKLRPVLD